MDDDFGHAIKKAREARGWSQDFLAAKVGATQSTIDRIESGLTRKSRVLPEISQVLNLDLPGYERKQSPTSSVGDFTRVEYVLPNELISKIERFKISIGIPSNDEAVRRIIDNFLKQRDDIVDVIENILTKYKLTKSIREAASIVVANHPLVATVSLGYDGVGFTFNDQEYGILTVHITSWGRVSIKKKGGSNFMFHKVGAPAWVPDENLTEDSGGWDYVPF